MYDYYDEEPFYEPTVADEIFIEYTQKLKDALKDNIKQDIENIKSENQRLKEENEKYKSRENEIACKERELEYEKQNLMYKVRQERLSELMKDFQVIMYKVGTTKEMFPKCNNCDENRKIHFTSPLGREMTESCTCNISKTVYIPVEFICTEFKINKDNNKTMSAWYKLHKDKDYDWYQYQSDSYKKKVYEEGMDFEKLDWYCTFFKLKEECQKYCDWLNEKEDRT